MNLDKIRNSIHKKQKYLFYRLCVLTLLIFFTYRPMFFGEHIDGVLVMNTTIFLIAPLFIEYGWGMQTYNKITNTSRTLGFFFTFLILAFCVIGLMGGYTLVDSNDNILIQGRINSFDINVSILLTVSWLTPLFLIVDFIFTFTRRELEIYNIEDELFDVISQKKLSEKERKENTLKDLTQKLVEISNERRDEK